MKFILNLFDLLRQYCRKPIPQMAWSPESIVLFEDIKRYVTSLLIAIRYESTKPMFLKTDWSSTEMGWILMQPAQDKESIAALETLLRTGKCTFDLSMEGARLKPISFGSRSCTPAESKLHSFTGEVACGRWAIVKNKKHLWGQHLYWLCDCAAIKEILEYSGSISMICRWAQKLLGYQFTVIQRSSKMLGDVDTLSRKYGLLICSHL